MLRSSFQASFARRCLFLLVAVFLTTSAIPLGAASADQRLTEHERLEKGQVVVGLRTVGATKYVTGSIIIDQPASHIWPVMTNPFEFQGKISPRMKTVEMIVDKADESVMKVTMDLGFFIPNFNYVVDSKYQRNERIDFKRIGGTLKDFSGSWEITEVDGGKRTQLTYAMFVDPGFYVPQWIVREGMKRELPDMLTCLRKRVDAVYLHASPLEHRSILASRPEHINRHPIGTASSITHHLQ